MPRLKVDIGAYENHGTVAPEVKQLAAGLL